MATTYRLPKLASRREFFWLPYPVTTGATLAINGANYKVGEVSERGLRIVTGVGRFPVDARIQGVLTLATGTVCPIAGTVLRVDDDSFVLKLKRERERERERGPTSHDVIRKQRFVAKSFPDWKPQPA